jgi:hypothetical protein
MNDLMLPGVPAAFLLSILTLLYGIRKQILDLRRIGNRIAIVCKVTAVKFEAARKYVLWHIRMHGISVDN